MNKLSTYTKKLFICTKKYFKDNITSITKEVTTSILIAFLAILFIPIFNGFICKYIEQYTNKLLDLDNEIFIFIDWGVILLAILTLAITIYRCNHNRIWTFPSFLFNTLLFSCIIWGYESLISKEWVQLDILNTEITYSSLAVFLILSVLIIYFCFWSKSAWVQAKRRKEMQIQSNNRLYQRKKYAYTDDAPISKAEDDILGRKTFARNLANWIYDMDVKKGSSSIAINSPWGYGKTSFLNLIKEQIEKYDNFIVIEFSPWHFSPASDITKMFFLRLENEFKGINNKLSDFLAEYSDLLSDSDYSFVQKLLRPKKDYENLLTDISSQLENSDKKLIIIIDDFDRLSATEIQEVLRLIRGSANFPNFIFLTAFDKDYVQKVLSESSEAITPHYIEKFFEHEYNLPIYSQTILKNEIIKIAEQFMEENDLQAFKQYISQDNSLFNRGCVFEPLGNLRGVYRWMNNISVKYSLLKSECLVNDLADLELLNMFYPKIYSALERDTKTYLIAEHGANYVLYDETKANNDKMGWFNKKAYADLKKTHFYTDIPVAERKILDNILDRLLSKYNYRSCPKSFRDSNYTNRYFYQDLSDNDMSDEEFIKFIKQPLNVVKNILDKDEDAVYLTRIWLHSKDQIIESKDEIESLLHVMYYAMARYGKYFDFEIISKYLEKLELTESEKRNRLISLINENGFSFGIVACYSFWNQDRSVWHKYLSEDDMNEILRSMLQYSIEEGLSYEVVRECHMRASVISKVRNEEGKQIEKEVFPIAEIENMYQTYIAKSLANIIPHLIWANVRRGHPTGEYYVSKDFTRYWDSWTSFEDFCRSHQIEIPTHNDFVNEFMAFVMAYNDNENQPLKFEFKNIKLPE
ncbi:MAG: hypothetical protein K2H96_07060 [Muribaculaceae bacterium]|nr:hypothetical protein [Muribaculaceae bacterium]